MATIILTGGGSAGHVTPHLAILPYLKKDFDKIYYLGSVNGIEKNIIDNENIPYYSVPCAKLNRSFNIKNFSIPFKLISGIKKAESLIDKLKPDIIFSKGGYVALPVVIAGKRKNVPIIAHESDYTIGLANKISAKYCKKVLTSFPDTSKQIKNGEYVGAPIRKNYSSMPKSEIFKFFGFSGQKPILLVFGGSQGAFAINDSLLKALPDLLPKFDIIHICGKNNYKNQIKFNGYYQVEYMNDIEKAFSIASICVSRAGSNSIFELLSLKIPCLLIPLPKGNSRGDQVLNAEYFQRLGLVSVLPQNVLTPQSLVTYINSIYANRFNVISNYQKMPVVDASRQISRILIDAIH